MKQPLPNLKMRLVSTWDCADGAWDTQGGQQPMGNVCSFNVILGLIFLAWHGQMLLSRSDRALHESWAPALLQEVEEKSP